MHLIEFVGLPRTGKSTQAELLMKAVEAEGKSVVLLSDRERMAALATPPQESLAFALAYYGSLLDAYWRYRDKVDVLLIDRGWNDAAVWADVYLGIKVVSEKEREALAQAFARFAALASAVLVFSAPLDVIVERHKATLHEGVDDVAMRPEWLEALVKAYAERKPAFTNPLDVDGTLPPEEAHARIVAFLKATGSV